GHCGTALCAASLHGHVDIARLLLDNGASVTVQWLLHHGADANARIGEHMDPLEAASSPGHLDVVRLLLAHGANVSGQGTAALRLASANGHLEVASLLLEKGASADGPGGKLESPLRIASASGHLDIIRLLCKHHADINAASGEDDETALQAAARRGDLRTIQFLLREGADLLLERHADVSICGPQRRTPLSIASERGHTDVVRCLLGDPRIDVNAAENEGYVALQNASLNGHLEIVQLLLQHHPDVNVQNSKGQTSLYVASMKGHAKIAQCLIDNGAD
ncbi:ankyrin repeat-containing domain protein, partial [Gloeopeniophorella convolvens]